MGFYIRQTKRQPFSVWEEISTPKRVRRPVPTSSYITLGFNFSWTFDEARDWAKHLNKKNERDRRKAVATARRIEEDKLVDSIYLPPKWIKEFDSHLQDMTLNADDWLNKLRIHWNTARGIILELEITPEEFYDSRYKILKLMLKEQYSVGYIKRLRFIMNQWGTFYARKTKTFFEPIPALTGTEREKTNEVHEEKSKVRKPAKPLEWPDLQNKLTDFKNAGLTQHWNWLCIGVWFGLRPLEIDNLKTPQGKYWRIDRVDGYSELHVFQTKLRGIPKNERWKVIPAYFPEQIKALEIVLSGEFKRPLVKTMVDHLDLDGVDTYSPRKAFTDLMLGRGYSIEDVAIFMGHRDMTMTWKAYKGKKKYKLPKTGTEGK